MGWREDLQKSIDANYDSLFLYNKGNIIIEEYEELFSELKNTNITYLNFEEDGMGDAGAIALAKELKDNPQITKLYLRKNKIGDAGAKALAKALKGSQITSLMLSENNIGDAGAVALAQMLKGNPQIVHFALDQNKIGDAGAKALAESLKGTQIIKYLWFNYNQIGKEEEKAINDALKENEKRIKNIQRKFKKIFKNEEELSEKEKLELIEMYLKKNREKK